MAYKCPPKTMKKIMIFLAVFPLVVSCNTKGNNMESESVLNKEQLQGAWYAQSLEVNNQIIDTHEYPECLSAFVFKDDKVKLIQMSNNSENGGYYKISNETIYIHDLVTDQCVMKLKVNEITEKKLDLSVLDEQGVKMMLERMEEKQ